MPTVAMCCCDGNDVSFSEAICACNGAPQDCAEWDFGVKVGGSPISGTPNNTVGEDGGCVLLGLIVPRENFPTDPGAYPLAVETTLTAPEGCAWRSPIVRTFFLDSNLNGTGPFTLTVAGEPSEDACLTEANYFCNACCPCPMPVSFDYSDAQGTAGLTYGTHTALGGTSVVGWYGEMTFTCESVADCPCCEGDTYFTMRSGTTRVGILLECNGGEGNWRLTKYWIEGLTRCNDELPPAVFESPAPALASTRVIDDVCQADLAECPDGAIVPSSHSCSSNNPPMECTFALVGNYDCPSTVACLAGTWTATPAA